MKLQCYIPTSISFDGKHAICLFHHPFYICCHLQGSMNLNPNTVPQYFRVPYHLVYISYPLNKFPKSINLFLSGLNPICQSLSNLSSIYVCLQVVIENILYFQNTTNFMQSANLLIIPPPYLLFGF